MTHPRDMKFHTSEPWSPYNRAHNQIIQLGITWKKMREIMLYGYVETKRVRYLKEPSRSIWKDLCYLEEDLVD
jgi:hypothetical protein